MKVNKLIRIGVLVLAVAGTCIVLADDDDHDEDQDSEHHDHISKRNLAIVSNPTYRAECASCHMLYPPGLLPARSWQKVMGGLKDHFGENATLDTKTSEKLTAFLVENSADHSSMRRSEKIANSIGSNNIPIRFTDTLYFKRQHHEIGAKIWQRKAVGSPANCAACHNRAEAGIFSEDEVRIPR